MPEKCVMLQHMTAVIRVARAGTVLYRSHSRLNRENWRERAADRAGGPLQMSAGSCSSMPALVSLCVGRDNRMLILEVQRDTQLPLVYLSEAVKDENYWIQLAEGKKQVSFWLSKIRWAQVMTDIRGRDRVASPITEEDFRCAYFRRWTKVLHSILSRWRDPSFLAKRYFKVIVVLFVERTEISVKWLRHLREMVNGKNRNNSLHAYGILVILMLP